MSWTRTRAGAAAIVLAGVMAGALLTAGSASAASRGYRLHNTSKHALKLEGATHIPHVLCNGHICVPTAFDMEFEGRPADGAVLHPNQAPHAWELKWYLGYTYAAKLTYKIEGTDATVEYTIETSTYTNNSACKVIPAHAGHCTASGLTLGFKNS